MRKPIIKKGQKFNRLTAIKFSYKNKVSRQFWLFKCDCGNEKIMSASGIKGGSTKSCGCLRKGINFKHGMLKSKVYKSWVGMKSRCLNKNATRYKDWGGRGITICKKWLNSFENFYRDMGEVPEGLTLDRINNNKGYCKENCRWATPKQQANNRRNNLFK